MNIYTILFLVIILCAIVFYFLKNKVNLNNKIANSEIIKEQVEKPNYFPIVKIEENENIIPDEKNKISDENLKKIIMLQEELQLAKIEKNNDLIKKSKKEFIKGTTNNVLANGVRAALFEGKELFTVPAGTKKALTKVNETNNKFFAFIQGPDGKIQKNVRLESVELAANINTGMSIASAVVGQYYMAQIDSKLEDLKDDIKQVSDFLDTEYQAKFEQVISKIHEITANKAEILSNEYSRDKRYNEVIDLETNIYTLLGHANNMIEEIIKKQKKEFRKYENNAIEVHKWFTRQQILQELGYEIGKLRYILANGNETLKLSLTQYNNYLLKTNDTNYKLKNWTRENCEKFEVDFEKNRRRADYYEIKKITLGLFNEDLAYERIDERVKKLINSHKEIPKLEVFEKEKYDEEIKILKYNGEYYNMLPDGQ